MSKKICIICEGSEEYDYIDKLTKCNVWDKSYSIKLKNANSINRIMPIYQHEFQNANSDLILIFCDTEMFPYVEFEKIIKNLNDFHGTNIAKDIVFFANPCTMQIILSHFSDIKLYSNSKNSNANNIKNLTGVTNYQAYKQQRCSLMRKINFENYITMKLNLKKLGSDCKTVPSTNFLALITKLESPNTTWVSTLSKKIIGND